MTKLFSSIISTVFAASTFVATQSFAGTPQFPFPQKKQYPYGTTATYVSPDVIQTHFKDWKNAWYKDMGNGTARIISPNDSTELTASEGIAYGMLIMVYMSNSQNNYQSEFDKLYAFWNKYAVSGSETGMNWKVDTQRNKVDNGTATDADLDVALALVMASKQWNDPSYLTKAKSLISWIKSKDMESDGRVKAGSNWNPALNASYVFPAAFQLFYEVTNDDFWKTAITVNTDHIKKCQNSKTGLMPDWCDWNKHTASTNTGAAVSGGSGGFYDDAARTPWRMAWGYYWYGIKEAKAVNDNIVSWLDSTTYSYAGLIMSGYRLEGKASAKFVSSTFSGGLGLAMASADKPKYYLETVYDVLSTTTGRKTTTATSGEKYYPATLNILYLLTMSGNLPNFYNMTGYKDYTQTQPRQPKMPAGTLIERNSGVNVSGFESWGTYADKLGTTVAKPDSGSTGIFKLDDGSYEVAMEARIAPEPTYIAGVDLEYPFAGIAMSFSEDEKYIDLRKLDKIKITYKSQGVIRLALLDKQTLDDDNEGGEPGYILPPTEDFRTIELDVSEDGFETFFTVPSWVGMGNERNDVLKAVRGLKFDPSMSKGGFSSIHISKILLEDADGNIMGTDIPPSESSIKAISRKTTGLFVQENKFHFTELPANSKISVFSLDGTLINALNVQGSGSVPLENLLPTKGIYLIKVNNQHLKVTR